MFQAQIDQNKENIYLQSAVIKKCTERQSLSIYGDYKHAYSHVTIFCVFSWVPVGNLCSSVDLGVAFRLNVSYGLNLLI